MKNSDLKQARRWWSAFARLPQTHAAVEALAASSQARSIAADEMLVKEGDDDGRVFLVTSGGLRTVRHTRNGHEVWLADVNPGEITGDMAALTGGRRTSCVMAKETSAVLAIPRDAFLAVATEHAEFCIALARMLALRLQTTSTHLAELVALPVSTRLHGELAAMGAPTGDREVFEVRPPPTVLGLGQRVHATREAASRALGDLQKRGFVKRGRSAWTIIVPSHDS